MDSRYHRVKGTVGQIKNNNSNIPLLPPPTRQFTFPVIPPKYHKTPLSSLKRKNLSTALFSKKNQKIKSQPTSVTHRPTLAQKTARATLRRSVACFSSRLPPPTLSAVSRESATSCCTWADCRSRFCASVVCSEEISSSDDCAVLGLV